MSRKQFLEYKLKISARDGGAESGSNPAELVNELNELQRYLSGAISGYESFYGEPFTRPEVPTTATINNNNSGNSAVAINTVGVPVNTKLVNTSYSPTPKQPTLINKPVMAPAFHRKLENNVNAAKGKLTATTLAAMKK